MATVTASLVVNFLDLTGDGGILNAEIDGFSSAEGGLNAGDTSFSPGDQPVYLLTKSSNVTIVRHETSLIGGGGFLFLGQRNINVSQVVTFADSAEASLSRPSIAIPTITWFGNDLGPITQNGLNSNIIVAAKGIAAAKIEYQSVVDQYRLVGVPVSFGGETTFSVVVFIEGVTT